MTTRGRGKSVQLLYQVEAGIGKQKAIPSRPLSHREYDNGFDFS